MFKRIIVGAALMLGQSACLTSLDTPTPSSVHDEKDVTDSPTAVRPVQPGDSTSLWMQYGDPSVLAARAADQGPLEVSSKRHGCNKFKFHTLGDVLADLGVNMAQTNQNPAPAGTPSLLPLELLYKTSTFDCNTLVSATALDTLDTGSPTGVSMSEIATRISQSARYLYCSSRLTLGQPPYAARLAESTVLTTAGVTKLFDTLAAASAELAKNNLAGATRCAYKDPNDSTKTLQAVLFNPDNTCNERGMACLQGYLPSPEQVNLCNRMVVESQGTAAQQVMFSNKTTVTVSAISQLDAGKRIATSAILANAMLCE